MLANRVYQEYISDKSHLHMNATRWVTLTEFIKHLGRTGVARVDETEKGWFIAWIDNSPKALAKQVRTVHELRRLLSLIDFLSLSVGRRTEEGAPYDIRRAARAQPHRRADRAREGGGQDLIIIGLRGREGEGARSGSQARRRR